MIDIRANDAIGAIPSNQVAHDDFEALALKVGAKANFEIPKDVNKIPQYSLRHYHVWLLGEKPSCP